MKWDHNGTHVEDQSDHCYAVNVNGFKFPYSKVSKHEYVSSFFFLYQMMKN